MQSAKPPTDELHRLDALYRYQILDTEAEQIFDDLTQLAAYICDVPIALISLIDPERQWFKSKVGVDVDHTSREIAFCAHAILEETIFEVEDARLDQRFHDNPLVTQAPNIRFYAGAQLVTPSHHAIGTLCVIDDQPKHLNDEQKLALERLSRQVISNMELRLNQQKLIIQNQSLTQQQVLLKEARRIAEQANQTKDQFLATMSHELRTPLTSVLGSLKLVHGGVAGKLPDKATKLIATAVRNGDRLLSLVNDLLDFSKIKAGKMEMSLQVVESRHLVEKAFEAIQSQAEDKGLKLIDKQEQPCLIQADPQRIEQVLINLMGNAIKFTEQGSITLSIQQKQDYAQFCVSDSGCGIPEDQVQQVFRLFSQLDNSSTRKTKGTGLGLAICESFVQMHGGKIWVQSHVGQGSSFFFTIPLAKPMANRRDP
ncbi:sensor histidine kinase [Magnetococcus sp. PR-3]|uniref:sensor histidine kinase n=1 Tax=Magnetococcus sp. PR-3 TaxID=3120355 RepID=UPI002FCDFF7B